MDTPIDSDPDGGDAPTGLAGDASAGPADGGATSVDPRMRDRWVSARRDEGRRRLRIFVGAVTVLSLVGLGYIVANSSLLGVDDVQVRGTREVPAAAVTKAARIESGEPLLFLDTDAVVRRIEAIPEIGKATVETELPNTVVITVTERRPLAWVQAPTGGPIAVLDGTGRVLRTEITPPALTRLVGAEAPAAPAAPGRRLAPTLMAGLAALPAELQLRAASLEFTGGVLTVTLRGEPPEAAQVRLGGLDLMGEKGRVATAILEDLRKRNQRVALVDVTVPSAPVTR